MERYGQFYGCDSTGRYAVLRTSPGMVEFLSRSGANSPSSACEEIVRKLSRFERFPNYFKNSADEYPVSVCYAPMHLSKTNEIFASMKPLYAIAVNGGENRIRDTSYACCAIMSAREILESKQYTWLDHMFGTPLVSWMDMYELREKRVEKDCSMKPSRVDVTIRKKDLQAVLASVGAIYSGKTLVIRVEDNFNFNRRSMEILSQIYSLLPPRLAVEIGFATYQTAASSRAMKDSAGIRVYVIPGEAEFPELGTDVLRLDLNHPEQIRADENDPVIRTAKWWSKRSCAQRCEAMRVLFADPGISFMDAEKYVELSTAFSRDVTRIVKPEPGSAADLEQLKQQYDAYAPRTMAVRWVRDEFRKNLPVILTEGVCLDNLKAQAAAKLALIPRDDRAGQKKWIELFRFACLLETGEADKDGENRAFQAFARGADLVAEHRTGVIQHQLETEREDHKKALEDQKTLHTAELEKKDQLHREAMTAAETAHEAEKTKYDEELRDSRLKLAEQAEQHRLETEQMAAAFAQEKTAIIIHWQQELTAERTARANDCQQHTQDMEKLRTDCDERLKNQKEAFRIERDNLTAAHEAELKTEQGKTAAAEQALGESQERVQKLTDMLDELRGYDFERKEQINELTRSLNERTAEREDARARLKEEQRKSSALNIQLETVEKERENAVRKIETERDSALEKVTALENRVRELKQTVESGRNMKELIMVGISALAAGIILASVVFFLIGMVNGDKGETIPTTLPVETTVPVETTLPPETTVPVETTLPPETTVPPTEPGLDEIDWDALLPGSGMTDVIQDPNTVQNLLYGYTVEEDCRILGIVTNVENGFAGEFGTVLPDSFAVLTLKQEPEEEIPGQTEPEEPTVPEETTQPSAAATELTARADLIIQAEHYGLIVVGGEPVQQAALRLFCLVNPREDPVERMEAVLPEGIRLELNRMVSQVLEEPQWWSLVERISVLEEDLNNGRALLNSSRTPVAAVFCGDHVVYVYDYTDDAEKAQQMLQLQSDNGRPAVQADGMIAICCPVEQIPEPSEP